MEEEQVRPDRGRQAVQAEGLCGEPQLLRAHLLRQVLPGERAQPGGQHVQVQAEKAPDHERGPHLHGAVPGQRHHHPVQGRRLHGRGGEQGVGQERAGQERHQDAPDYQLAGHPHGARGRQGAQAGPPVPAAPGDILRGRPAAAQGVRVDLQARDEAQGGDAALPRRARVQAGEGEGHGAAALPDVGHGAGRVQAAEAARRRPAPAAAADRGADHPAGAAPEAAERTVLLQAPRGAQPQRAQAGLHHGGPAGRGGGGEGQHALRVRGHPGHGVRGPQARADSDH